MLNPMSNARMFETSLILRQMLLLWTLINNVLFLKSIQVNAHNLKLGGPTKILSLITKICGSFLPSLSVHALPIHFPVLFSVLFPVCGRTELTAHVNDELSKRPLEFCRCFPLFILLFHCSHSNHLNLLHYKCN